MKKSNVIEINSDKIPYNEIKKLKKGLKTLQACCYTLRQTPICNIN